MVTDCALERYQNSVEESDEDDATNYKGYEQDHHTSGVGQDDVVETL